MFLEAFLGSARQQGRRWMPLLLPSAAAAMSLSAVVGNSDPAPAEGLASIKMASAEGASQGEQSVSYDKQHYGNLGLNGRFLKEDAVDFFSGGCCEGGKGRFEDPELREIARSEVHAAILREFRTHGVGEGSSIIDVGAGTGLFLETLARFVGKTGHVQAIDITPPFIDFMKERIANAVEPELRNRISVNLCTSKSTCLHGLNADAAFICDVYHHFEFPKTFMSSLRDSLRPGAIVMLVDFYRDPDKMTTHEPSWALSHLRAGRHEFLLEILETGGFELVAMPDLEGLLEENYCLIFKRRDDTNNLN